MCAPRFRGRRHRGEAAERCAGVCAGGPSEGLPVLRHPLWRRVRQLGQRRRFLQLLGSKHELQRWPWGCAGEHGLRDGYRAFARPSRARVHDLGRRFLQRRDTQCRFRWRLALVVEQLGELAGAADVRPREEESVHRGSGEQAREGDHGDAGPEPREPEVQMRQRVELQCDDQGQCAVIQGHDLLLPGHLRGRDLRPRPLRDAVPVRDDGHRQEFVGDNNGDLLAEGVSLGQVGIAHGRRLRDLLLLRWRTPLVRGP
mmetsp:Transcript_60839/g.153782  ORF Transcript_60839/g.153782 Transcript_60839/m.153782 type:complete len:257 (-) Transcript_60839:1459-2229(-)